MTTVKRAQNILLRARSTIELELWELEAEAHRRFRDGRSLSGLAEAMVRWKEHLSSLDEAEAMLDDAKHATIKEQKPVCRTIIRNLGRFPIRIVTRH